MSRYRIIGILIFTIPLIFGCVKKHNPQYIYNEKDDYYSLVYPDFKLQGMDKNIPCRVNLTLDKSKIKIKSAYTTCMQYRSIKETIEDIKNIIEYFNLQQDLKRTHAMDVAFMQGYGGFPNFIKYLNRQDAKVFNKLDSLFLPAKLDIKKRINYLKELERLIVKSNIYSQTIADSSHLGYQFILDLSLWSKTSRQPEPNRIGDYTINRYGILKNNEIKFKAYHIPVYLPLRIKWIKAKELKPRA